VLRGAGNIVSGPAFTVNYPSGPMDPSPPARFLKLLAMRVELSTRPPRDRLATWGAPWPVARLPPGRCLGPLGLSCALPP
jgi:hypothetical protein